MADGKFYWLKLKRDFFKRHDIKIIEGMPNGKDYLLFYLKLLCESVDHNGNLRFSDEIPYDENMLSILTGTNVDIVRSAIKLFTQLNMMQIFDNGTYFMNEVDKMIGCAVDNDNANRQRRFRERQKELALQDRYESVTKNNEILDIRDKNIKENNNNNTIIVKEKSPTSRFSKPTIEEIEQYIEEYCKEKYNVKPLIDANYFYDFYESKNWYVGKNKMKDFKASVRMWVSKKIEENPSIIKQNDEDDNGGWNEL